MNTLLPCFSHLKISHGVTYLAGGQWVHKPTNIYYVTTHPASFKSLGFKGKKPGTCCLLLCLNLPVSSSTSNQDKNTTLLEPCRLVYGHVTDWLTDREPPTLRLAGTSKSMNGWLKKKTFLDFTHTHTRNGGPHPHTWKTKLSVGKDGVFLSDMDSAALHMDVADWQTEEDKGRSVDDATPPSSTLDIF